MKKHWFNWLSNEGLKHRCGLSKSMDNSWGDSDGAVRDSSDLAIEKLLNEIEYLIELKQKILRLIRHRRPELSSISTGSENDSNVRSHGLGIESSTSTNGSDYSENSIDKESTVIFLFPKKNMDRLYVLYVLILIIVIEKKGENQ